MEWFGEFWRRLAFLLRKRQFERDLAEEMRHHTESKTDAYRDAGLPAAEARYLAQRQFGNQALLVESSREMWSWHALEVLTQDARYACRQLLRAPGFTAVAVLCLAVGIGVNSTVFSLVDGMWMRPLPVKSPGELVYLSLATERDVFGGISFPEYEDFRDQSKTLSGLAVTQRRGPILRGDGFADATMSNVVSEDYFSVLGVSAQVGRVFTQHAREAGPVVVMSDSLWRRRFGSDPAIVGKPVRLGRLYTVIGIAPRGFRGIEQWIDSDFWIPMSSWDPSQGGERIQRESPSFTALGRLRPGISMTQARAEVDGIARNLQRAYPRFNQGRHGVLYSALEYRLRTAGSLAGILLGIVALVLLIACANVANLLLARAGVRSREIGVRMAIGAGRARIVRQLLTESTVIASLGVAAGLLLARWLIAFLPAAVTPPGDIYTHFEFRMDARVLACTLALSLLTVLAFGLFPALRASSPDVVAVLKGADQTGPARSRSRGLLVIVQVALSMLLLTASGLLVRTFLYSMHADLGFQRKDVLVADILPSGGSAQVRESYRQILERLRATPGVRQATLAMRPPLWGSEGGTAQHIQIPGRTVPPGTPEPSVKFNVIGQDYFRTLGIPLLHGRDFELRDSAGAPPVVVVSESMAQRLWPNQDAIGQFLHADSDPPGVNRQVVGIAGDARINSILETPEPYFYLPYTQSNRDNILMLVETDGDPLRLAGLFRAAVAAVDRRAPVLTLSTLGLVVRSNMYEQELAAAVVGGLGLIALILAAVGLYGVISYTMVQRTREIGIRMAIGAQRSDALRLILGQGLRLAGIGIAAGFAAALAAGPLLSNLVYGVSPRDPLTFASVALLMLLVALAASFLPARRATRIDPLLAVRHE
ncbi:ADOP family duplicated permease [Paludibaculum fermentans]|uniref:ABC transporter permease n=1 Tax=Paludibaculum fermentans TaxID=1473598 RepID=UPI003EBFD37E